MVLVFIKKKTALLARCHHVNTKGEVIILHDSISNSEFKIFLIKMIVFTIQFKITKGKKQEKKTCCTVIQN